jgi:phosphoglycolate phosphatase
MDAHNITYFFSILRTRDDISAKGYRAKPFPDKLNSVLNDFELTTPNALIIGYTIMDIEMAKNASVTSIGVTWGFNDANTLISICADKIVNNVNDLKKDIYDYFI